MSRKDGSRSEWANKETEARKQSPNVKKALLRPVLTDGGSRRTREKKGSCWGFLWFSALLFCFKIKGLKQNNIQNSTTAERKKQPAAQIRCPSRRCSWWLTKPFQQKVPHTTGRMSAEKQWHVWSMAPWFCSRKRNPHVRPCCTFYILICL